MQYFSYLNLFEIEIVQLFRLLILFNAILQLFWAVYNSQQNRNVRMASPRAPYTRLFCQCTALRGNIYSPW